MCCDCHGCGVVEMRVVEHILLMLMCPSVAYMFVNACIEFFRQEFSFLEWISAGKHYPTNRGVCLLHIRFFCDVRCWNTAVIAAHFFIVG